MATTTGFFSHRAGVVNDPFDDMASQAMPRNMPDALLWSQAIHMIDGTYREAMARVAAYFITDIKVSAPTKTGARKISRDEKDKFDEFLRKTLGLLVQLHRATGDFLTYGNSFSSVLMPFRRYLSCPHCPGIEYPLGKVYNTPVFEFAWVDFEFHARCPKCQVRGAWPHNDRPGGEESPVKIKHWNPHEIEIIYDDLRDDRSYVWQIPETYRRKVREGNLFTLERAFWAVIQAVKHGDNFLFDPDVVYHMFEPPLAGVETEGWGLSKSVTNFRQAWHCQMLRRFNEAICQEFLIPFRVISPSPKAGADPTSSDPVLGTSLATFRSNLQAMIKRHKRDPGTIQISPFPFEYQMLGGEANTLAPFQLLDQATDSLLNGAGVPADLYKGTLSLQAAPVGLRLFESRWRALVDHLNSWIEWVVDKVATLLNWEPVDAQLLKVTHADDMNRQMAKLQLMMGQQISQRTGLKSLDIDFETEQDQLVEEQEYVEQKRQELAERMQGAESMGQMAAQVQPPPGQAPAAGLPPPGGAPPASGAPPSGQPPDPQELLDKARQIAEQIMQMPESQRRSELINLKKVDPALHALVKAQVEDIQQQAQTAGGAQVLAQQFGKQGGRLPPRHRFPQMLTLNGTVRVA